MTKGGALSLQGLIGSSDDHTCTATMQGNCYTTFHATALHLPSKSFLSHCFPSAVQLPKSLYAHCASHSRTSLSSCVWMHVFRSACLCVEYAYTYVNVFLCIRMQTCIYVQMQQCGHVNVLVCIHVCVFVYVCTDLSMRLFIEASVQIYVQTLLASGIFWFWVQGFGFRVQVLESRVQGFGFRVQSLWFRSQRTWRRSGLRFGFRVQVFGSGFRVPGSRFRVSGSGFEGARGGGEDGVVAYSVEVRHSPT